LRRHLLNICGVWISFQSCSDGDFTSSISNLTSATLNLLQFD
jgi:hypothetical protein